MVKINQINLASGISAEFTKVALLSHSIRHFVKFLGIGGIATLIQFLLLSIIVELKLIPAISVYADNSFFSDLFSHLEYKYSPEIIASAISYLISSVFNYFANYYFTFGSNLSHYNALPKFIVVVALGLTASTLLFSLFFLILENYIVAQLFAAGITVFLNYLIHKLWIYKGSAHE